MEKSTCDAVDAQPFLSLRCPSVGIFRRDGVLVAHHLRRCGDFVLQVDVPQKLLWDPPVGRGWVCGVKPSLKKHELFLTFIRVLPLLLESLYCSQKGVKESTGERGFGRFWFVITRDGACDLILNRLSWVVEKGEI